MLGLAAMFIFGFFVGIIVRDRKLEAMYQSQQARGDHWFSRYIAASRVMQDHHLYLPNDTDDFYK